MLGGMTDRQRLSLERRLANAQQHIARWQAQLDAHPDATPHQRGVWRGQLTRWRHEVKALERRLNQEV